VGLENSIRRLSLPGQKSPYSSSDGSRLTTGKGRKSDRSSTGWAVRFALDYFHLPESKLWEIAGAKGREFLLEAWRVSGAAIYQMPEYALRQEWFHGYSGFVHKRIPDEFYDAVTVSETILDWGCGTAEAERQDWIDRGRKTILMDLPGPNLEYVREKYRGYPVTTLSIGQDVVPKHCRGLICIDVLEHLERPIEAVKFLWDNLKPGGFAVFWFDPSYPHPGHLRESTDQINLYDEWLSNVAIIHKRGLFDFVEKPRRWWTFQ
jgi:SAM-dependent methyltransferase